MAEIDSVLFAKALADETRQEIMKHLCCVWLSVNDIVDKLGGKVNQPTVSHHLKKLEEGGLVLVRQVGRQRFYSLNLNLVRGCCTQLVHTFAPDYVHTIWWDTPVDIPPFEERETSADRYMKLRRRKRALRSHRHWAKILLRKRQK